MVECRESKTKYFARKQTYRTNFSKDNNPRLPPASINNVSDCRNAVCIPIKK